MGMYLRPIVQFVVAVTFAIWIFGAIAKKAGYSRWLGFAMLIPLLNIGTLIWFAYSEWPIETSLHRLRNGETESDAAIWRSGF